MIMCLPRGAMHTLLSPFFAFLVAANSSSCANNQPGPDPRRLHSAMWSRTDHPHDTSVHCSTVCDPFLSMAAVRQALPGRSYCHVTTLSSHARPVRARQTSSSSGHKIPSPIPTGVGQIRNSTRNSHRACHQSRRRPPLAPACCLRPTLRCERSSVPMSPSRTRRRSSSTRFGRSSSWWGR